MIVTVTLNAALDVTYELPRLELHDANRVQTVHVQPGGKGINVARIVKQLGGEVLATGLIGGASGEAVRSELRRRGIAEALVPIEQESRRTVAVVESDAGAVTLFNEPGPRVSAAEWCRFLEAFAALLRQAKLIVLAGSLPPGVPTDAYAQLVNLTSEKSIPTIVDADGPALLEAIHARPTIVKLNTRELANTLGEADAERGAARLIMAGAGRAVVTLGADGLLGASNHAVWRMRGQKRLVGNPTGAGDACTAALALGEVTGEPWEITLQRATATAGAAVLRPVAGELELATVQQLAAHVDVEYRRLR